MGCAPLLGAGNLSAPAGAQCGGLQLRPWCAVQLVTADFNLPTIEQFAGRAPLGWLQGRQLVHMCHVGTCCPLLLPGLWLQCLPASMQQGRALDQLQAQWTKPGRRPHWPAPTSASSAMASAASAQSSSVSPACTLGPASDAKGTATQPSPAAVSARAAAVEAGPLRLRCFRAWAPPGP